MGRAPPGMVHLEQAVIGARGIEGIVLRYGWFYGPGGASNAKAKRELGWRPAHASWRQGLAAAWLPDGRACPFPMVRRRVGSRR
jgi:hypothetical protein